MAGAGDTVIGVAVGAADAVATGGVEVAPTEGEGGVGVGTDEAGPHAPVNAIRMTMRARGLGIMRSFVHRHVVVAYCSLTSADPISKIRGVPPSVPTVMNHDPVDAGGRDANRAVTP